MKTTIKGVARFYIDIDTSMWGEDSLMAWSEVYAEVETLGDLAEDVLSRYINGNKDLPTGISIVEDEVYVLK